MFKRFLPAALLLLSFGASAASSPAVVLHGQRFSTEFATTDDSRAMGFMNRTSIPGDHSMLFVFADDEPRSFWMKNTLVPLDILYFDKSLKLVAMQLNAQPCKADPCSVYPSGEKDARYVLELNGGVAGKLGLKLGDALKVDGDWGKVQ